jgi:hypothetical protein
VPLVIGLTDLSSGGFKCVRPDHVPTDGAYRLNLGFKGTYPVQIRWMAGDKLGGQFLAPITSPDFDELVTLLFSPRPESPTQNEDVVLI